MGPSDRTLRAIYDALDSNNAKFALNLCDKHLKKHSDSSLLQVHDNLNKALKALCLVRVGKKEEAVKIIEPFSKQAAEDPQLFHLVSLVLTALDKYEQLLEIHEKALEADPNNEELFKKTFYALVRVKDYKRQYQLASKYFKLFKTPKYSFWAIMSLLLQGNSEAGSPHLFYQLSQRIAEKAEKDGHIKTLEGKLFFIQELQLYITTLLEQEQYKAAVEVIDGPYKSLFSNEIERTILLCELNKKLSDWPSIEQACRELLISKETDDWGIWANYFEALKLGQLKFDPTLLQLLMNSTGRTEMLALIEHAFQDAECPVSKLDALQSYIGTHGSKAVCFFDISNYLRLLSDPEYDQLLAAQLKNWSVEDCCLSVTWLKIHRFFKGYFFEADRLLDSKQCLEKFMVLHKNIELIDSKRSHDDLLVFAVYSLMDLCECPGMNHQYEIVYYCLGILKHGMKCNPFNHEFKLIAMRLLIFVGSFKEAQEIFKSLDVKHIQLDTLSYLISDYAATLGFFEESIWLNIETMAIYHSNRHETPEMVVEAYKRGTFSKITEFIIFWEQLEFSVQRLISSREIVRVELLNNIKNSDGLESFLNSLTAEAVPFFDEIPQVIHDNRDKEIIHFDSLSKKTGCYQFLNEIEARKLNVLQVHFNLQQILYNLVKKNDDAVQKLLEDCISLLNTFKESDDTYDMGIAFLSCFGSLFPNFKVDLSMESFKDCLKKKVEKLSLLEEANSFGYYFFKMLLNIVESCNNFILLVFMAFTRNSVKAKRLNSSQADIQQDAISLLADCQLVVEKALSFHKEKLLQASQSTFTEDVDQVFHSAKSDVLIGIENSLKSFRILIISKIKAIKSFGN